MATLVPAAPAVPSTDASVPDKHIDEDLSRIPEMREEEALHHSNEAQEALNQLVQSGSPRFGESDPVVLHKTEHIERHPWLHKLIPPLQRLASYERLGNFVIVGRGQDSQQQWESMPIYVRLGMHLLFCTAHAYVSNHRIEQELQRQSIAQGKLFDSEIGAQDHIASFILTYELEDTLQELLEPDPKNYKTFNDFFTRQLKPGARPVDGPADPSILTSAADCRLTVYNDIESATQFWIKSKEFTLATLFNDESLSNLAEFKDGGALAIFRLAPADFHRFVSPVAGRLGPVAHHTGSYYTVNPQAVNQDFAVFTANRRDVTKIDVAKPSGGTFPVAFVAVGALLVGSIVWTKEEGAEVDKGDELGYFAYGGSTCIAVFPKGSVAFDEDLVSNSQVPIETQVKCGQKIGKFVAL